MKLSVSLLELLFELCVVGFDFIDCDVFILKVRFQALVGQVIILLGSCKLLEVTLCFVV